MRARSKRFVLGVVSDLHCGSTVGLCQRDPVALDDGGSHTPTRLQRWLEEDWRRFLGRLRKVQGGDPLGFLTNGDLTDGDHHGTQQIITRDPNVQLYILKKLFEPVLALSPVHFVVVRGTEAHVGKGASMEESFARWVRKEGVEVSQDGDSGMYSHWHYYGEYCGHRVDAAHHGRIGQRPWTKSGVVGNLCAQIVMEYASRGEPPPAIALRSHYHTFFDTHDWFPTRLLQTPGFQFHTAYAHRVVPEVLSDIGGLIITFERGSPPIVEPVLFKPARSPLVRVT